MLRMNAVSVRTARIVRIEARVYFRADEAVPSISFLAATIRDAVLREHALRSPHAMRTRARVRFGNKQGVNRRIFDALHNGMVLVFDASFRGGTRFGERCRTRPALL